MNVAGKQHMECMGWGVGAQLKANTDSRKQIKVTRGSNATLFAHGIRPMFDKQNIKFVRRGQIDSCKLQLGQLKGLCGAENCLKVIEADPVTHTTEVRIYPRKIMFNSWLVFNVVTRHS